MKIKLNDLPTDIQRYIKERITKRLVTCLIVLAVVIAAVTLCLPQIAEHGAVEVLLFYLIPIVIVLLLTGVLKMLRDRSWCGTVVGVKYYRTRESKYKLGASHWSQMHDVVSVRLDVRLDNGKLLNVEAIHDIETHESLMKGRRYAYKEGQRVYHIAGTKYIGIAPINERTTINCIICGDNFPKENEKCLKCGHSLRIINNEEVY